jgi:GNAT superfamily N-acetyltransferase
MQTLRVEQFGLGDPRIREFVALPWRLYRGDPNWTPPLKADYLGSRVLGSIGLLTEKHPYHTHADVTHWLAYRGDRAVGRISAAVNHEFNEHYDVKLVSFGFFEVEKDFEAASALLDAARDWCTARGMTAMRGPGEYSNATYERQGILIDGFDTPPTVECTHNPPYYGDYLEQWGLAKVKDYHAYLINLEDVPAERLAHTAAAVRRRNHIETRPLEMKNFSEDLRRVIHVYNLAWADNWGFLPIGDAEADTIADTLKPIIDPGLVRFAEVNGETVAMLGAFPDPNWALRPRWGLLGDSDAMRIGRLLVQRRHIPRVRLMFFGILPEYRVRGIDSLLFNETYQYIKTKGYKTIEASLLLENNDMILRASEAFGGRRYKTWRIYEVGLG